VLGTLGAEDPRCPLGGLEIPRAKATKAYRKFHCLDNFRVCMNLFGHFGEKFKLASVIFHYRFNKNGFNRWLKPATFPFKQSTIS